jgi:hypothetical protein
MPSEQAQEDPFARATTPTSQFLTFNDDFSSLDKTRFMQWVHPNRGLVKNGILLTQSEADAQFGSGDAGVEGLELHFNYGEFVGANCYQADCWLQYKGLNEENQEQWFRFHNIFVFEIIDSLWYLVQSEYIAPEAGVQMNFEEDPNAIQSIPQDLQSYTDRGPYTAPALPGLNPWPLLIGDSFASGAELHPIAGKTWSDRTWTLAYAVSVHKPTVMYFFSVHELSYTTPEEFRAQMEYLAGLYDTFGKDDLYIYGVTDEPRSEVEWLQESGYNEFMPLLDEGSALHATLNIDVHPYIVVFDAEGTVIALSKSWHPSSLTVIEDAVRRAMATAAD